MKRAIKAVIDRKRQEDAEVTVTKRKPKPLTAHPLFPVVTALWFATFFGLGSFAIAPSLLEGPVVALGIPALVPAATPPLGFTARIMLAGVLLLVGALVGYLVGRKLAPKEVAAPRRRDMATARQREAAPAAREEFRRPLNPVEDLGEPLTVSDEAETAPARRRALSLSDEGQLQVPSESAPLPGYLPWENPVAAQDEGLDDDPLALEGLFEAARTAEVPAPFAAPIENPATATAPFAAPLDEFVNAPGEPVSFDRPAPFAAPDAYVVPEPFVAAEAFSAEQLEAEPFEAEPVALSPLPAAPLSIAKPLLQAPAARVTPLDRAPLEGLGMVQLVERLAVAIARHVAPTRDAAPLETSAYAPTPAPAAPEPEAPVEAVAPAPVASEPHDFQRVVPLRPLAVELPPLDDEPHEHVAEFARFLRVPAEPVIDELVLDEPVPDEPTDVDFSAAPAEADAEVAEDRYPSLLDMGPVASRLQRPHIEDGLGLDADEDGIEPTVIFPGQVSSLQTGVRRFERPSILPVEGSPLAAPGRAAPSSPIEPLAAQEDAFTAPNALPDAEEADRALRAALATLQRMTAQG